MYKSIAIIRKRGNKWCVLSEDGTKNLGCYDSKEAAQKRLRQIEYFKHVKGQEMNKNDLSILSKVIDTGTSNKSIVDTTLTKGSVGDIPTDLVIDGKPHYPIKNSNQACSAISRVMRLNQVPDWFTGNLEDLRDLVRSSVLQRYPNLSVSVAMTVEKALANLIGDEDNDGVTKVGKIKNPALVNEKKVPDIPTPDLQYTGNKNDSQHIAKVLSSKLLDTDGGFAFAADLIKTIQNRIDHLNKAMELANRLLKDGISGEEFNSLVSFLQEDILRALLQEQLSCANKKDQIIAQMKKRRE